MKEWRRKNDGKKRSGKKERNIEKKARKIEKRKGQGAREERIEMWEREPESVP